MAQRLRFLLREALEMMRPCNPQHPYMLNFMECPEGHKHACGRCELVHRIRAFLKTQNNQPVPRP